MLLADIEIHTPRMIVRAVRAGDREQWMTAFRSGREIFARWFPDPPPPETLPAVFDEELAAVTTQTSSAPVVRLIGVLPDGTIAGMFNFTQIFRRAFHNAMAGWSVTPSL